MVNAAITSAAAQNRTWGTTGRGAESVLTDCRNCGDDIGIMISCKGAGQPAEVVVHWAAMNEGVEGAVAPFSIQVDGQAFTYQARALRMDAIGFPPAFMLNPGDPLLAALQAGRQARVRFGSASNTLTLNGARAAIDAFKAQCGWNQASMPTQGGAQNAALNALNPAGEQAAQAQSGVHVTVEINNRLSVPVDYFLIDQSGQPQHIYTLRPGEEVDQPSLPGAVLAFGVNGQQVASYTTTANPQQTFDVVAPAANAPRPAASQSAPPAMAALELKDQDGATWQFSQSQVSATAVFGVPETDATSVAIVCKKGGVPVMELFAAPPRDWGTAIVATMASGGVAYPLPTKANKERRLEATLDASSGTIKQAMAGNDWVTIMVGGKPAGRFLGLASSTAGRNFLRACPQFAR